MLVAWALQRADPSARLSMVAEEDSAELRRPEGRPMLERITQLVNRTLAEEEPGAALTPEEVVSLIGGEARAACGDHVCQAGSRAGSRAGGAQRADWPSHSAYIPGAYTQPQ